MSLTKDQIIEILHEWNDWTDKTRTGVLRTAYLQELRKKISSGEIIIITGVRRSGKSTLARQFIEGKGNPDNCLFLNFEDPRLSNLAHEDLLRIYEIYLSEIQPKDKPVLVLDEIQNVNGWEKFVNFLHERNEAEIIVTGSSSKLLSSEYSGLLTGRHLDISMYPLSFREYLQFKGMDLSTKKSILENKPKIISMLRDYLEFGGFPKPCLVNDDDLSKELLRTYHDDIINKDIQLRHSIVESRKLRDLAAYYLTNNSRLVSFNKTRKLVGLSLDSVERFSRFMEDAYLVFFVPMFSFSKKVQMVNLKKVYCIDTGLRNAASFRFSKDYGWNAENAVFLELKRRNYDIYYHLDKKNECDLIGLKGKDRLAIQVSWELIDKNKEVEGLISGMKMSKSKEGLILTEDAEEEFFVDGYKIRILPLWKWFMLDGS